MDLHLITCRPDWEFANINVIRYPVQCVASIYSSRIRAENLQSYILQNTKTFDETSVIAPPPLKRSLDQCIRKASLFLGGLAPAASCPGVNSSFTEEWTNGRILVVTFNKATDKMSEQVDYSPPIKIVTNFLNNSKF